jgi:hypothetical protein
MVSGFPNTAQLAFLPPPLYELPFCVLDIVISVQVMERGESPIGKKIHLIFFFEMGSMILAFATSIDAHNSFIA